MRANCSCNKSSSAATRRQPPRLLHGIPSETPRVGGMIDQATLLPVPGSEAHVAIQSVLFPLRLETLVWHAWFVGLYQSARLAYASGYVRMHSDRNSSFSVRQKISHDDVSMRTKYGDRSGFCLVL